MKRNLVLVHGRAQEDKDAVALKSAWRDALHKGFAAAGIADEVDDADIRFPYYGDTLRDLTSGDPEDAADVIVRGEGESEARELAFVKDVVDEMLATRGVTDEQVAALLDQPDVVERGPQNWRWVLAGLRALEAVVPGMSRATVALVTRDVHLYFSNPGLRDVIERGVRAAIEPDVENVVVAHSLGSIVAYSLLRREARDAGWRVPLLLTVGCPLGIEGVRDRLRPLDDLPTVQDWVNARDPADVVALHQLDQDHFPIRTPYIERIDEVDNHTGNHHGIAGYLDNPIIARRIHRALVG